MQRKFDILRTQHRARLEVKRENEDETLILMPFGSYLIDGVILRIKTQKARRWIKDYFVEKYGDVLPINVLVRMNPYRTLKILWMMHLRIALRGYSLKKFLQITDKIEELEDNDMKAEFIEKGVRVIPLAPAWIPRNRVLLDLIFEYISGKIDEDMAKKVFYSAFLKIFERSNIVPLKNLAKWGRYERDENILSNES